MKSIFERLKNLLHIFESIVADVVYGHPHKRLRILGVTGTDGKTTSVHMLYHVLTSLGERVAMISSVSAVVGGVELNTGLHTTTPRPFQVRKLMRQAVSSGDRWLILETTSHAMVQKRVWGIPYEASLLTNITQDHGFFHPSFDDYVSAKVSLLLQSHRILINRDQAAYEKVKHLLDARSRSFTTFSLESKNGADYTFESESLVFEGTYMKENFMGVYALCRVLGFEGKKIESAYKGFTLPKGRGDVIQEKPFVVMVDFAHTPHSLESALSSVKEKYLKEGQGRLIHVFGAASERDDEKRPNMGRVSSIYSDCIIVTEEDYRHESVDEISRQITSGFDHSFQKIEAGHLDGETQYKFAVIHSREDAIGHAIRIAQKGDVVICTGKGHEKSLNRDGVECEWDEYAAIERALKKYHTK